MSDPISDQTAYLLAKNPYIFTPLERLYHLLSKQGLMSQLEMEDYWLLLESDGRFEVLAGLGEALSADILNSNASLGLEVLNLLTGPWVLLRTRLFSTTEATQELLLYLHQMNDLLEATWQFIPNMPEREFTKDNLLNILMWSDLLEHQLRETLTGVQRAGATN